MSDIQFLTEKLAEFRDKRNWKQFHNRKDLALAISIEAAELNELFLWKDEKESEEVETGKIREELADIISFCLLLAGREGFDVTQIVLDKMALNEEKYPVEKAKGRARKYTELENGD